MPTNPYHYTGPIINKKLFMGHHSLKSRIVHALENSEGGALCVAAEASMGKSTLLHQVDQSLSSCLPVFIDIAEINLLSADNVYGALINGMIDCIKDCGCFPDAEGTCSISDGKRENYKQGSTKDYLIELVQGFEEKGTPLYIYIEITP